MSFEKVGLLVFPLEILGEFGNVVDLDVIKGLVFQSASAPSPSILVCCCVVAFEGARLFASYISYMSAGVPEIVCSWFSQLLPHDHEIRGFLAAFSNIASYVNQIWVADAMWRTVEAPRFKCGSIFAAVTGMCMVLLSIELHLFQLRETRIREREARGLARVDVEAPVDVKKHEA